MADKNYPTPDMLKRREKWEKMPAAEKEALLNACRTELIKYYTGKPSSELQAALNGEDE